MSITKDYISELADYHFAFHVDERDLLSFANALRCVVIEECAAVCKKRVVGDHNREDAEARRCAEAILELPNEIL